jgi:hypothetical protein
VTQQLAYAGSTCRSFAEAHGLVSHLTELVVTVKHLERVTERIGGERVVERAAARAAFVALPLIDKFAAPPGVTAAELVVVMADGGRLQIREPSPPVVAAPSPPGDQGVATEPDWDEEPLAPVGHWREDKIGLLLTMDSVVSAADPCPEIPAGFLDAGRIPPLAQQLKKQAAATDDNTPVAAVVQPTPPADTTYQPPQVRQRQVVASRDRWPAFAPLLASVAWSLGFQGAARRAFVGDGSANNWRLQRRFFGSFVPILDFIHALSYVFAAAMAGQRPADGWACYQRWIAWVWQGQVAPVLAALRQRQEDLGPPDKGEAETSPRQVVAKTLTYLTNHQDKMKYDDYRRQGLPITSSLMESVVKQINQRVKGTEKFWSEAGSEAVLHLRADYLSDGEPLAAFWKRRQATATGQRRYRRAA